MNSSNARAGQKHTKFQEKYKEHFDRDSLTVYILNNQQFHF
jgi:hypothetical protein